jgi:7-cyano-7-deazaguanine reductase
MDHKKKEELDLHVLGSHTHYVFNYNPDILETFDNKHPDTDYWVKFNCPEFTSLCPITNQPDFATIYISYVPDKKLVESKSLKLYLFSFRNHGDFHENCVVTIMKDLVAKMAASASTHTSITAKREPSGSKSLNSGWLYTISIRKKWITGKFLCERTPFPGRDLEVPATGSLFSDSALPIVFNPCLDTSRETAGCFAFPSRLVSSD